MVGIIKIEDSLVYRQPSQPKLRVYVNACDNGDTYGPTP